MLQCLSPLLYINVRNPSAQICVDVQICLSAWQSIMFKQTSHPDDHFNISSHHCHIKNVLFCEIQRGTGRVKKRQLLSIVAKLEKKTDFDLLFL